SRRRHTRFSRDWSSDVCSSDLLGGDCWKSELLRDPAEEDALAHDVADLLMFEKLCSDRRLKAHRRIRLRVSAITSSIARSSSFRSEERRVGKAWRGRVWVGRSE